MKFFVCISLAALATAAAWSQTFLNNGNSSATINPNSSGFPFQRGMTDWTVDGTNHLFQQWYWFRVGNQAEHTIDTISAPTVTQTAANSVNVAYSNQLFALDITFTLIGGTAGSGTADVGEIVRVTNLTGNPLDFHLFEYDDFDMSGTSGDDSAFRLNVSSISQFDSLSSVEVGAVPSASHWQIAALPGIFDALEDGVASNLTDSGSPSGPDDLAFAFQWDRTIGSHGTFIMSKDKLITAVPEPATMTALALGAAFFARRKRSS